MASNLEEKDNTISRREAAVKTMTEELIKANDIIRRLQADIRTLNQKVCQRVLKKYIKSSNYIYFYIDKN